MSFPVDPDCAIKTYVHDIDTSLLSGLVKRVPMLRLPPRCKEWRQQRRVFTLIKRCHVIEWAGP
jgi:hypothetical protein